MYTKAADQLLLIQNLKGMTRNSVVSSAQDGNRGLFLKNDISDPEYNEACAKKDKILNDCDKLGISIVGFTDPEYPDLLKQIPNFPPVLYYRGDISVLNSKICLAIIGSRKATPWSQRCAVRLAEYFDREAFCIVSGLAMGCDTAIQSAVVNRNGVTVSVLGQGLDKISPVGNKMLAEAIISNGGALISEKPPYSFTNKYDFAKRDRIQSGISRGVLLIQSESTGGSMITMKNAFDQGREMAALSYKDPFEPLFAGNRYSIEKLNALEINNSDDITHFKERLNKNCSQNDLFDCL